MGFLKHLFRGMGRGGHHSGKHGQKHDYGYRDGRSVSKVLIRCPKCDVDNEQNALFCQKCGSALEMIAAYTGLCQNLINSRQLLRCFFKAK